MADPPRISIADLADGAAQGPLLDAVGQVLDPLLAVDLDGAADETTLQRAIARARAADRLLIGITAGIAEEHMPPGTAELAAALDLTVAGTATVGRECVTVADPEEHLMTLHRAVMRNPQASTVLAGVLRMTAAMPVPAALDVESYAYSTLLGGGEFRRWLDARGPRPGPPAAEEPVLLDRAGDRLRVTLNRPERRNAYGRQVRDALVDALNLALLDDTVTRVVLDGAGPSFCSGGDLDEFGTAPDLATAHLLRTRAGAGRLIHLLARTMEVRVHGSCVGAGIELPAFAGSVIADPATTFRLPEIGMGLIPGAGGTVSIPRRIGRWRTLHLALTGVAVDASTARSWRLVDALAAHR